MAQSEWNWPEDEALLMISQEKQAYYQILMLQEKYDHALSTLKWLYNSAPDLNPSIYIDGTKCIEEILKSTQDENRIAQLRDSSLWMYDVRMAHFGNKASTIDRKASDLHLTEGSPPILRIDGKLLLLDEPPTTREVLKKGIYAMLSDIQKQKFEEDRELDFSLGMEGMERFRVNVHIQKGSIMCQELTKVLLKSTKKI